MENSREYWAFISYRHLDNQDAGREWATWIAREIETYAVPSDLVGTKTPRGDIIPERLYPVFRDEDELSAGADLSSPIYQALRNSKSLVVICSPRALGSRYVGNEISYYKSLGRASGVLAMMIEGEPHAGDERECFPKELKHAVDSDGELDTTSDVEPVAADFRLPDGSQGWHGLEQCRKNLSDEAAIERYRERCELAKLKVIAGILGVPLGQLVERDKAFQLAQAKKRARVVTRIAAAMALLAAIAIAAGVFAWQKRAHALRSQAVSEQTRDAAEGLVREVIFNLSGKLEPIGKIELLKSATTAAEQYFANLPPELTNEESERRLSVVYDTRAKIAMSSGDQDEALKLSRDSLAISRKLAKSQPDNLLRQIDLAIALYRAADSMVARNQPDDAQQLLDEARGITASVLDEQFGLVESEKLLESLLGNNGEKLRADAVSLLNDSPTFFDIFGAAAVIVERLGNLEMMTGDAEQALAHHQTALKIQRAMGVAQPDVDSWKRGEASSLQKLGTIHFQIEQIPEARSQFEALVKLTETRLAKNADDAIWRDLYAGALDRLSNIDQYEGNLEASIEISRRAIDIWRQLAAADPTNLVRQRNLFVGLHKMGLAQSASEDKAGAEKTLTEARAIARRLVEADPNNATWRRDLAFSLDKLSNIQRNSGDQRGALVTATEALRHHRQLSEGAPANLQFRRNLLLTLNGLAINHWALEELDDAMSYYTESALVAASVIDDLAQPTLQAYTDLADICVYTAQIAEQAQRPDEALKWYRKTLKVVLGARELELVGDEIETQSLQPLRKKIAELEATASDIKK